MVATWEADGELGVLCMPGMYHRVCLGFSVAVRVAGQHIHPLCCIGNCHLLFVVVFREQRLAKSEDAVSTVCCFNSAMQERQLLASGFKGKLFPVFFTCSMITVCSFNGTNGVHSGVHCCY